MIPGGAVLVMSLFWSWPRRLQILRWLAGGTAVMVFVRPGIIASFGRVFLTSGTDDSLYSREFGRGYAIDLWLRHPILGIGHSAYAVPYNPVLDNQYLGRLVEAGVVGLVTTVLLWLSALLAAGRAAGSLPGTGHTEGVALREIAVGLTGSLAVVLFSNSVLDTLGFRQVSTLTWVIMALAWATRRLARTGP